MNLSGEAVETKGILAPLIEFYADYDFSRLEMAFDSKDGDGIHRFRARANWKALWQNYAPDVYHEAFVHPMLSQVRPRAGNYAVLNSPGVGVWFFFAQLAGKA